MKQALALLMAMLLLGCDSGLLEDIEDAAHIYQRCLVHQVMPDECENPEKVLILAELRARQKGIEEERIAASREIGLQIVSGAPLNSPYQRISRSLKRNPFYIEPEVANFRPYKDECLEMDLDESNPDPERAIKLIKWWASRSDVRLQMAAYIQSRDAMTFLLFRAAQPCRPKDYLQISEEFPLVTEEQAKNLEAGQYLKNRSFAGYSTARVEIFDSVEKARARYHEIAGEKR